MAATTSAFSTKRTVSSPLSRLKTSTIVSPMTIAAATNRVRYVSHLRTAELRRAGSSAISREIRDATNRKTGNATISVDVAQRIRCPAAAVSNGESGSGNARSEERRVGEE